MTTETSGNALALHLGQDAVFLTPAQNNSWSIDNVRPEW